MNRYLEHNRRLYPCRDRIASYILALAILLSISKVATGWTAETAPFPDASSPYPKILRFAMVNVLGGVNSEDAKVAIDIYWSKHLDGMFPGIDSQFEILPDVAVAEQRIRSGRLHGLSLGVAQYLELKNKFNLRPIFISSRLSRPLESYLLLVRKGINWQSLSAQPVRHMMTEKMVQPNLGRMWLETLLNERGLSKGQVFFTKISQGAKPARIILPVFFDQADACLVPESAYTTMVELNPQISRRLTILERSPGFIKTIHCSTDLLPEHMADRFIRDGVQMDDGIDGRQLLLIFHVKRNFVFQPEFLGSSERVYHRYQSITK